MTDESAPARQPWRLTGVEIWMAISQVIGLLSLIIWLPIAGLSFMAFDSGDSAQAWTFVSTVLSYPLLPLGCAALAWILYATKRRRAAVIVTSIPVVAVIVLLGVIGFLSVGSMLH